MKSPFVRYVLETTTAVCIFLGNSIKIYQLESRFRQSLPIIKEDGKKQNARHATDAAYMNHCKICEIC